MPRRRLTQQVLFETEPEICWTKFPPRVRIAVIRLLAKLLADDAEQAAARTGTEGSDER